MEKVAQVKAEAQKNEKAATQNAAKDAEFKAKKQAAAKAFAERQKAKKEQVTRLFQWLIDNKQVDKMPEEFKKIVTDYMNPATRSGGTGTSFFNKVFGATPKVGDSVKLIDYMQKTLEGKAKLDKYVKEWNEKGIVVEVKPAADIRETLYTIKKM